MWNAVKWDVPNQMRNVFFWFKMVASFPSSSANPYRLQETTDRALFSLFTTSQGFCLLFMAIWALCFSNESKYAHLSLALLLFEVGCALQWLWNATPCLKVGWLVSRDFCRSPLALGAAWHYCKQTRGALLHRKSLGRGMLSGLVAPGKQRGR